jgi:ribosome-associated protein
MTLGDTGKTRHPGVVADLLVRPGLMIPERALRLRFARGSGPGGQSVNTSDSRVELLYDVRQLPEPFRSRALARLAARLVDGGVLRVVAEDERSQLRNRRLAEQRLTELLRAATAAPPPARRPTRPSRAAVQRRIDAKRRRGAVKRRRAGGSAGDGD